MHVCSRFFLQRRRQKFKSSRECLSLSFLSFSFFVSAVGTWRGWGGRGGDGPPPAGRAPAPPPLRHSLEMLRVQRLPGDGRCGAAAAVDAGAREEAFEAACFEGSCARQCSASCGTSCGTGRLQNGAATEKRGKHVDLGPASSLSSGGGPRLAAVRTVRTVRTSLASIMPPIHSKARD